MEQTLVEAQSYDMYAMTLSIPHTLLVLVMIVGVFVSLLATFHRHDLERQLVNQTSDCAKLSISSYLYISAAVLFRSGISNCIAYISF